MPTDRPNPHAFEKEFIDLVDASETRDLGISLFEQEMHETEERLTDMYAGAELIDHSYIQDLEEGLNDKWLFGEEVAKISGRVYLADSEFRELLPKEWGDLLTDGEGGEYFFLEDVELRSHGIEIIPIFDHEGDDTNIMITEIKVGYSFSDKNDPHERPILTAYIGELSTHQYDVPTPAEAEARLARHWPEEFALIQQLMIPDLQNALPSRLSYIFRRLQKQLTESPQFRKLVELSINDRLSFDEEAPYVLTAHRNISAYDGDNPYDPEDQGNWLGIPIKDSITILANWPVVRISEIQDDIVQMNILMSTYNMEDDDTPEYVRADVHDIYQFRSTRVLKSIISRALAGSRAGFLASDSFLAENLLNDVLRGGDEAIDNEGVVVEGVEVNFHEPIRIREMRILEDQLKLIAKEVREAQKVVYSTTAEAEAATKNLMESSLMNQLISAGIFNEYLFEFSGRPAIRPRQARDLPDVSGKPHILVVGNDVEEPFVELQDGDNFTGLIKPGALKSFYREFRDEGGNPVGYTVYPSVLATIKDTTHSTLTWQNVSIVDVNVQTRAIIPLDGSVEMDIVQLEYYKSVTSALDRVSKEYSRQPVATRLHRIHGALNAETTGYQPLRKINSLVRVSGDVQRLKEKGKSTVAIIDALEAMFVDRLIAVEGNLYTRTQKGYELQEAMTPDQLYSMLVVDVRDDIFENDVVFVLRVDPNNESDVRYIPISTIKSLSF